MKTKDTMSDNELIAEFMGVAPAKAVSGDSRMYHKFETETGERLAVMGEAGYSYSWDWLMPVVARINQLWMGCGGAGELGQMCDQVILMHISDNIERVYGAVVFFIKWYNANQPKP